MTKYLFQGKGPARQESIAQRSPGRLYATELAHRGASVVVNDLGGTMPGARFGRVVGLGEGWPAESGSNRATDDIATHLSEVTATEPFTVLGSIFEEVFGVCERLGINPAT